MKSISKVTMKIVGILVMCLVLGNAKAIESANIIYMTSETNALYCVIDLSGGPNATNYPVSYLNEIPNKKWSNQYRTTNLVLRLIYPGISTVTVCDPYYIGVFEVTQKQWELVMGETPSYFSGNDRQPVEQVSYDMIRGSNQGAQYPSSTNVDNDSFIGRLRIRTGLRLDLPSATQWEYACRSGTTTAYYYGDSINGDYMWYCDNSDSSTHVVGNKKSNDWGLFDMHGNVWEWCLEWDSSGLQRILRGGSWKSYANFCTSSHCDSNMPSEVENNVGFRLAIAPQYLKTPVIMPATGTIFATISQSVSLSCDTEDATIYYTIDGSEPSRENGRVYKGPFDIYETATVKAIAVKDDWKDSAVASATFTKANELGPAINLLEVLPDNDKNYPWSVVTDVTHDGVSAVKSGDISDDEATTMKVVLYGAGRLSFWWKTSCEPSIDGELYDYATFYNGSTAITNLAGVTDWQQVALDVAGTGKHTFKWTYAKDGSGSTVPDGMWLDQVQWLPATTDYYAGHTLTTETPIPYSWLDKYRLGRESDFESAAKELSGKFDVAGHAMTVEDEYVAGTDPTNETSHLEAQVDISEGFPKVTWKPDLNEDGAKLIRAYKVWGKETLSDDWEYPTNSYHHFFKVTVEMP